MNADVARALWVCVLLVGCGSGESADAGFSGAPSVGSVAADRIDSAAPTLDAVPVSAEGGSSSAAGNGAALEPVARSGSSSRDTAPEWPFTGWVQLWYRGDDPESEWWLRFWSWDPDPAVREQEWSMVPLPGLEVDCLGRLRLVLHGEHGVELGGSASAASSAFWVDWGGDAGRAVEASDALLEAVDRGRSNVAVRTRGDTISIGEGSQAHSYVMRKPARSEGEWWSVQARLEGELFSLIVHPAHLPCLSGVAWLSRADTGELLACGASTMAVVFAPHEPSEGDGEALALPDPEAVGSYLSCPAPLDFYYHDLPTPPKLR